jgi:beta-galactosidase
MLFGADYNPEQWTAAMGYPDETIWLDDVRLMQQAGVNVATVGVFSWATLQPNAHTWSFEWLDRLLDLLAANGLHACLGTATAAQPAWLSLAHPDVLPVNADGLRMRHGNRMNYCPTSPTFRHYAHELVRRLAERYRDHPALLIWHVSNEYGPACYCDGCAIRFRAWLQERYGTLDELNRRWVTPFWGHTFGAWDEIEPPGRIGDQSMQGLLIDYARFMSDMNRECYREEAAILRALTPGVPVMTNFHGLVKHLDYFSWAADLDLVTWDSYPPAGEHWARRAFLHALMRGLKGGQSWLLLEQTPSQTQWRPFNPLKRPGEMRLQSYQAMAHGSDGAMFFQWRQSRGSVEMHHGAVVGHAGHEHTRVFREVAQLGAELKTLGTQLLGARSPARVALMFSWPNWWAVEFRPSLSSGLDYLDEISRYYVAIAAHNVAVDIIPPGAALDGYDLVVAPLLYMLDEDHAAAIERFVEAGGAFLTTYCSAVVGTDGRAWLGGYPGPLRTALGIWVEEADPLLPGQRNTIVVSGGRLPAGAYPCDLWCEVLHLEGAQALGTFGSDFYAGGPAITEHAFGQGLAYYVATRPDAELLRELLGTILGARGIAAPLDAPEGVEVTQRQAAGQTFTFVLNHTVDAQQIPLPRAMRDLIGGQSHVGELRLPGRDVAILVEG